MRDAERNGRDQPSPYDVLQVSPQAAADVIQAAFRALARSYHPDVSRDPDAPRLMRELNAAYAVLSDPERRARYDAERARAARVLRGDRKTPARPARAADGDSPGRASLFVLDGRDEAAGPCPKLGFVDDRAGSYPRPTQLHRCFAGGPRPVGVSIQKQRELCLGDGFASCPRFVAATAGASAPGAGQATASRRGAQPRSSAGPSVESPSQPRPAPGGVKSTTLPVERRRMALGAPLLVIGVILALVAFVALGVWVVDALLDDGPAPPVRPRAAEPALVVGASLARLSVPGVSAARSGSGSAAGSQEQVDVAGQGGS